MTPPASTGLAEQVLPLIRTRMELYHWRASNAHGAQMHEAVDILEKSMASTYPKQVYTVTTKAIASAMKVIARADDSSGIIGDACRRLLALHPATALAARAPAAALVKWMITFQFDGEVDYFELDPVAYAPALGELGMARYRKELLAVEAKLGPRPSEDARWSSPHLHEWFVLGWNDRRLAVLDHDIDAIIRTHARDRRVAAWLQDTAEAFEEIGEIDLAIDWARQAAQFDGGHQAKRAAQYLEGLLAAHRPAELASREFLRCERGSQDRHHGREPRSRVESDVHEERLTHNLKTNEDVTRLDHLDAPASFTGSHDECLECCGDIPEPGGEGIEILGWTFRQPLGR